MPRGVRAGREIGPAAMVLRTPRPSQVSSPGAGCGKAGGDEELDARRRVVKARDGEFRARNRMPPGRAGRAPAVRNESERMPGMLKKVRALVDRLMGEPVCDDCIAERLGLPLAQHANHGTGELAGEHRYERNLDDCVLCGATKRVIRKRK